MRRRSVLADQVVSPRPRPRLHIVRAQDPEPLELAPLPVRRAVDWRGVGIFAAIVVGGIVAGVVIGGAW